MCVLPPNLASRWKLQCIFKHELTYAGVFLHGNINDTHGNLPHRKPIYLQMLGSCRYSVARANTEINSSGVVEAVVYGAHSRISRGRHGWWRGSERTSQAVSGTVQLPHDIPTTTRSCFRQSSRRNKSGAGGCSVGMNRTPF